MPIGTMCGGGAGCGCRRLGSTGFAFHPSTLRFRTKQRFIRVTVVDSLPPSEYNVTQKSNPVGGGVVGNK